MERENIGAIKDMVLQELLFDTDSDKKMENRFGDLVENIRDVVPVELIEEVSLSPGLIPYLVNPSFFLLALQSNHVSVLNTGITNRLQFDRPPLYNLLKKIWRTASYHIHPFQKGATHQGTHHCHVVNKNLNRIGRYSGLNFKNIEGLGNSLTIEEGFVLKVAAAVHDLGKAHVERSIDHEIVGYNFVCTHNLDLHIPTGLQDAIALIVRYHDGDDLLDSTASLLKDTLDIGFVTDKSNYNFKVRLKYLAAIFRLADVMDMTNERVSDIVFRISVTNPPPLTLYTQRKIINRKCVKSVDFNVPNKTIDITTFPKLVSTDIALVDGGIAYENGKLAKSTTSNLLDGISIPNKFNRI